MAKTKMPSSPSTVTLHYQKNPLYRSLHVDGAYAGITPRGELFLTFFSERLPIPLQSTHEFQEGKLGAVVDKISKDGVIREIDVTAYINIGVAEELVQLLNGMIAKAKEVRGEL